MERPTTDVLAGVPISRRERNAERRNAGGRHQDQIAASEKEAEKKIERLRALRLRVLRGVSLRFQLHIDVRSASTIKVASSKFAGAALEQSALSILSY